MNTQSTVQRATDAAGIRRIWESLVSYRTYWLGRHTRRASVSRYALILSLLSIIWITCTVLFAAQPTTSLDRLPGFYPSEATPAMFRWTASSAVIPLGERSGPKHVRLTLDRAGLEQPADGTLRLVMDGGILHSAAVGPQSRHFEIMTPAAATSIELHSPVVQPTNDWRWLGVRLLGVHVEANGLPLLAARNAVMVTAASVPVLLAAHWATMSGYGILAFITGIGIVLRFTKLSSAPTLLHRDEAVKIVDAWFLSQTGRDHLGAAFPMTTFEAYGDWVSPLLTYLQVPIVALFGPQPLAARLLTATVGTLAIPFAYGLARSLRLPLVAAYCAALVVALSPWHIFLSRVALEVALVPTFWTLSLWAAVRFVQSRHRRDALFLAVAPGITLYAYPTMKMLVPLLVALTTIFVLVRWGRKVVASGRLAAVLFTLLASPLVFSTLFNRASQNRLNQVRLRGETFGDWTQKWWQGYSVYWQPNFYYFNGGLRKDIQGVPGYSMALDMEAPFLLIGLVVLVACAFGFYRLVVARGEDAQSPIGDTRPRITRVAPVWWLVLAMVVLAPLPASLTRDNPNVYRASAILPIYTLIVAMGAAATWNMLARWSRQPWTTGVRWTCVIACSVTMVWQSTQWFNALTGWYPRVVGVTWFYADAQIDAMKRVATLAPAYDEIWLDPSTLGRPEIYLLLAQPMKPQQVLDHVEIERQRGGSTIVNAFSPYSFKDLTAIPQHLPVEDIVLNQWGSYGYIFQTYQDGEKTILVVRGLEHRFAAPPPRS